MKAAILLSFVLVSFAQAEDTLPLPIETVDITPPRIEHNPMGDTFTPGEAVSIKAGVTDRDSGIQEVNLFFRTKGSSKYNRLNMDYAEGSKSYLAEIPARYVDKPGVEYYIEAIDKAGNKILRGVQFSPMKFAVNGSGGAPGLADAEDSQAMDSDTTDTDTSDSMVGSSTKKTWWYVAGGTALASVAWCYSSCDCAKDCPGPGSDTGSVSVRAPAP